MNDTYQILNYLSSNKDRLMREYHLTKIGVFGSVASGDQSEQSDIDIIVEFDDQVKDLYMVKKQLGDEIKKQFNRPVDICREKYIKPIIKKHILSQARYV
ncbi:MAG: nucleotidyltransferase domain-containing protein [Bacteroidales bacterium]|nr:nucleotidyltransferase domain-containing protein [Bacteroidales bacterium]MBS3777055.1 nucleotidyltransferase domain-containing protein [Bacteroidales bacterium]